MIRALWNSILIVTGVSCFGGLLIVIAASGLDRAIAPEERLPRALVGMGLCVPFFIVYSLRTFWLRQVGIYRSFADLREAVLASASSQALTLAELDWLNGYGRRMALAVPVISPRPYENALGQDPDADPSGKVSEWDDPLRRLYEFAKQRRHLSEEARDEFRKIADIAFRFLAADCHVRERTEPGEYHPQRFWVGRVSAGIFTLCGLLLVLQGILGPARLMLTFILAGVLVLLVSAGIFSRWRWALLYALAALSLAQLAIIYLLGREALPIWIPSVVYPIPTYFGLYLYRRRRWFSAV